MAYGKRDVGDGKEGRKSVEELAKGCPFPLASEEGYLCGKGVVLLRVVCDVGEGSGSGGGGQGGSAARHEGTVTATLVVSI